MSEWDLTTNAEVLGSGPGSACLVVISSPTRLQLGRVVVISKPQTLGRGEESDVALSDAAMSRRHAELLLDGSAITVRDLGSRNGTWVNDARVTQALLRDGDRLRLGATTLHFHAAPTQGAEPFPGDALEQAGVALWEAAVGPGTIRWSRHADVSLGLSAGSLPVEPAPLVGLLHPDEPSDVAWLKPGATVDHDLHLSVAGQERWVHLRGQVSRIEHHDGVRLTGTAVDVTVARQRELAVSRHALVFENLSDAVLVTDLNGRVVDLNSSARQTFGVSRSAAQQKDLFTLVGAREPEVLGPTVLASLSSGGRWTSELALGTPAGPLYFEALGFHLREDGEVVGAAWLFRDVSERRRLEARLNHIDRLASLGTMSAGIAHELNNPLSYVLANARYVLERMGGQGDEEVRAALSELQDGALRIANIVGDLRTFSRSDAMLETQPTDVAHVVDAALRVTAKMVNAKAKVQVQVTGVPMVEAFEPRLVQVLVNLLLNAAQAVPEAPEARGHIEVRAAMDGVGVAIEVQDDGVGMAPEVQQRIFDPFFTTRPVGFGSGLGLAVCHGLVTAMGGTLSVNSTPGKGSTFRLWLRKAQPRRLVSTPVPFVTLNRRLKVLMVDDEPLVLKALARILWEHEVTSAAGAAEALARVEAGEAYDVVLCDLMMPDRSGIDFYEALQAKEPELVPRVVFLTGGAFTERAERFLREVPNRQLLKPVDGAILRQVIGEVAAKGTATA